MTDRLLINPDIAGFYYIEKVRAHGRFMAGRQGKPLTAGAEQIFQLTVSVSSHGLNYVLIDLNLV